MASKFMGTATRRGASHTVSSEPMKVSFMATSASKKRGGRPPLHRDRHTYRPRLDVDLVTTLQKQADDVGLKFCTYLEHVLAGAHAYHGAYMQDLDTPLPTALPLARLRRRTRTLSSADCPSAGTDNVLKPIRVDRPLANQIEARCSELGGIPYSDYIRGVLDLAAGRHLPGQGIQTPLSDELIGGVERRRSA